MLRVTWVRSTIGHKAGARGHHPGAWPASAQPDHRDRRHAGEPRHDPPRRVPAEGAGAGGGEGRSRTSEAARSATAVGRAQAAASRRSRARLRSRQDRGPWHEGPEVPCRLQHPGLVRGRPDAAPRAHAEAARLQEPLPRRVRGAQPGPAQRRCRGHAGDPGGAAPRRAAAQLEDARAAGQDPGRRRRAQGRDHPRACLHALSAGEAAGGRQHGPAHQLARWDADRRGRGGQGGRCGRGRGRGEGREARRQGGGQGGRQGRVPQARPGRARR